MRRYDGLYLHVQTLHQQGTSRGRSGVYWRCEAKLCTPYVARRADPRVGVAVRPVRGSSDVACRASRVLRVRCVAPIPEGTWRVRVTKLSVKFLFVLAPLGDIHDL